MTKVKAVLRSGRLRPTSLDDTRKPVLEGIHKLGGISSKYNRTKS